jgi:hypothetical protein
MFGDEEQWRREPCGDIARSRRLYAAESKLSARSLAALRFAFFMHYWDPHLPLLWKHGEIPCPQPEPMPSRLGRLMPYRSCD